MFRKLVVWAVMAIYLTVMSVPAAVAQEGGGRLSQEQALEIAKKAFNITTDDKNLGINYREDEFTGKKVWDFNWQIRRYNYYKHYSVAVDADTGEILNYSEDESWNSNKNKKLPKPITREAALAIAKSLAEKMQPRRIGEMKLSSDDFPYYGGYYGPKHYGFNFVRLVNGIPFPENGIRVIVNANNSKVAHYSFNWNEGLTFPAPDKAITKDEAEKLFRSKIGLNLRYFRMFGPYPLRTSGKEVPLYYIPGEGFYGGGGVIDALSGKIVDSQGREKVVQKVYVQPAAGDNSTGGRTVEKTISMEEAKKLAQEIVNIPADYKVQYSSYHEGWGPDAAKVYEINFAPENFRSGIPIGVSIDAETGELRQFNKYEEPRREGDNVDIKYDWKKCRQIALDFIKKVAPQKQAEIQVQEQEMPAYNYGSNGEKFTPPTYYFNFTRLVRGIPLDQNNISVEVDNQTGEVRSFWMNWENNLKFASPDKIVSEEDALNRLLADSPLELTYMRKSSADGMPGKEVMLVYTIYGEAPNVVNAATGEVTNISKLENPPVPFEDVSGHWAEREINLLAAAGILSGSGKNFNPDKSVTRAEFVTILANAKGLEITMPDKVSYTDLKPDDWFAGAVEAATKAGWVKGDKGKFNPYQPVTRQEMAVIVAKAMGMDMPSEIELDFKDKGEIAPWALEAVKISVELELLSGRDGRFAPREKATKAEAAVFIFKAMERTNSYGWG